MLIDPGSAGWASLKRGILKRIDKLRDDLEQPYTDPAQMRGEIAGLRWLMREVEPDAKIEEPTSTDYLEYHREETP